MRLSLEPNRVPDKRIAAVDAGTPSARPLACGSTETPQLRPRPRRAATSRPPPAAHPLIRTRVDGVTLALVVSILGVLYAFIL